MISVKIELGNKPYKDGRYRLYLRLTENKRMKRIGLDVFIENPQEWNVKMQRVQKGVNRQAINNKLDKIKGDTIKMQESEEVRLSSCPIETLYCLITGKKDSSDTGSRSFIRYIERSIEEGEAEGQIRNMKKYRTFSRKLEDYLKSIHKDDLTFEELTVELVEHVENFLKSIPNQTNPKQKLKMNTVSVNMSVFRKLVNSLYKKRLVKSTQENPFSIHKIPPRRDAEKMKLSMKEIEALIGVSLKDGSCEWHARNMFLFSFYCGGIRIADLLQLRWSYITPEKRLVYTMNKNAKLVDIALNEHAHPILALYEKYQTEPDGYIFPFLNPKGSWTYARTSEDVLTLPTRTKKDLFDEISRKTALINKSLKKAARKASIETPISSHIARHSFASIALQNGVSLEILQAILHHSRQSTTEHYAGQLSTHAVDAAIMSFDKAESAILSLSKEDLIRYYKTLSATEKLAVFRQLPKDKQAYLTTTQD